MASRGDYFPVEPEDRSSSRLLEENPAASPDDAAKSWGNSGDTKPTKLMSTWTFSLIVIGLAVMFLVGVCVGFYVRELQKSDPELEEICGAKNKKERVDYDKLGGFHESLVYYIRGEQTREFVSKFGTDDPVSGSKTERLLAEEVLEQFNYYGIDSVDIEEHEITVTSADPGRPNRLEVLGINGTKIQDMLLANSLDDAGSNSSWSSDTVTSGWRYPHVAFSPAGQVQASLVYCHYGRDTDFMILQALGAEVKDRVVLLRLGKLSLADKIRNSEAHGVRGVILYWDPQDVKDDVNVPTDPSFIPFASATTYSIDSPSVWTPSVPCQTVSSKQAEVLISLMARSNNSISAPVSWQGSQATPYFIGGQKSDGFVVRLSVFNIPSRQRIRNFISTIQGTEEPDRYVVVGAPRSALPGQSQDVVASTSVLAQLAQGIHYIHSQHKWKPRRGVKLISWGGAEFSSSGMLYYIMTHHNLLERRAVAYYDLSQLAVGNASIVAFLPPALHQLIKETTFDVPDPKNPEQTLQMSWKLLIENDNISSQQGIIPLNSYHGDNTHNPFLHVLGVPEVKVQYRAATGSQNSVAAMTSEDLNHHYKFHITVAHILVKSLLSLLDNEVLPYNLQHEALRIQNSVISTLNVLDGCLANVEDLHPAETLCKDLISSTEALREITEIFMKRSDQQGIRMVDDIKITFERIFVVRKNGKSQHILYPAEADGSLSYATDLCEVADVTKMGNVTREFEETLVNILKEAVNLFRVSA